MIKAVRPIPTVKANIAFRLWCVMVEIISLFYFTQKGTEKKKLAKDLKWNEAGIEWEIEGGKKGGVKEMRTYASHENKATRYQTEGSNDFRWRSRWEGRRRG